MTIQRKAPGDVRASHGGKFKTSVPLYNQSQLQAQAAISRRFHVSPSHAAVITGFLGMGGAENG